jgi:hypothetical protein
MALPSSCYRLRGSTLLVAASAESKKTMGGGGVKTPAKKKRTRKSSVRSQDRSTSFCLLHLLVLQRLGGAHHNLAAAAPKAPHSSYLLSLMSRQQPSGNVSGQFKARPCATDETRVRRWCEGIATPPSTARRMRTASNGRRARSRRGTTSTFRPSTSERSGCRCPSGTGQLASRSDLRLCARCRR